MVLIFFLFLSFWEVTYILTCLNLELLRGFLLLVYVLFPFACPQQRLSSSLGEFLLSYIHTVLSRQ